MTELRILKIQVQRKLKQTLVLANTYFEKEFITPKVNYNVRGAKAGVAYLQRNEIRFNPILLQENSDEFIKNVVPHELAHIIVYQQFGKVKPHGKEWQALMEQVFGVPAETCHQFELGSVRQNFQYKCDCQTHLLTIKRHNAIQQKGRRYICKNCRKALKLMINV
ncbi:SprT family zinc-dependent metalloprotease [Pasteurella atlantica]|uniref:SprT family zinc-dependent metalloprotease n=1 Tax=Pasteurellaceae TaxID=712 RepID=UPI00274DE93B|nr:SprT family zinc-dependent metalloprotease [Pasteurella atlantica]MDP8033463.1 SprT family zinc-dependent metalloprotease [Pasteurella atlantica]MDP8035399.1 SprT family zinc-dependent metalloprotease [Pasteurella atlantica]MDP8037350.1 SprT family zinc-dependent metalloprotease [Pasteurella atlantica]MDP8047698.1 SprT family zinc-dependent metalloprotease [Pasteurella atlantica]MDP8049741.1 SprT family zinc-dependent metalloprotease [Pasteurella atlantica]